MWRIFDACSLLKNAQSSYIMKLTLGYLTDIVMVDWVIYTKYFTLILYETLVKFFSDLDGYS